MTDDVTSIAQALADNAEFVAIRNSCSTTHTTSSSERDSAWSNPDLCVLRCGRREPPLLPLQLLGPEWGSWIAQTAEAAAAPTDYVLAPLLASASALIGNARWPVLRRTGWSEPPHLWFGAVGDSGSSKSPGADCIMRDVLPEMERCMCADHPDRLAEWKAQAEAARARREAWEKEVRVAHGKSLPPPLPVNTDAPPEPEAPRLRQHDVTIEKVALLLAGAAPKGLLIVRDELAGWLLGMTAYNDAGRTFWIESYGGRPFRQERVKHGAPIDIPRFSVAVTGGTQPDKLAELMRGADDGLLARICWVWPEPIPFRLADRPPAAQWAIDAFDRLRLLDLAPGEDGAPPKPVLVPLTADAEAMIELFARDMQERQQEAGGLLRSAFGKARGLALRLSMVLEFIWWCGKPGIAPPPAEVTAEAMQAACGLIDGYLIPMAERVYGDAAARREDRDAATLARWIVKTRAAEVHVRTLQREVRLPGLTTAEAIHAAAAVLIDAGWLREPLPGTSFQKRGRSAYPVNPAIRAVMS